MWAAGRTVQYSATVVCHVLYNSWESVFPSKVATLHLAVTQDLSRIWSAVYILSCYLNRNPTLGRLERCWASYHTCMNRSMGTGQGFTGLSCTVFGFSQYWQEYNWSSRNAFTIYSQQNLMFIGLYNEIPAYKETLVDDHGIWQVMTLRFRVTSDICNTERKKEFFASLHHCCRLLTHIIPWLRANKNALLILQFPPCFGSTSYRSIFLS